MYVHTVDWFLQMLACVQGSLDTSATIQEEHAGGEHVDALREALAHVEDAILPLQGLRRRLQEAQN